MSELGRWFDPTVEEDEARRRPTAPRADELTLAAPSDTDLPPTPADELQNAVPGVESTRSRIASSALDFPESEAVTAKASAIISSDPQMDRVDAEAEAEAVAKYDQAVLSAIAVERMVEDTVTSELIHDIAREFNTDTETVRRNLRDYRKPYWEKQALKLSEPQKKLVREDPALASDIFKDRNSLAEVEDGLTSMGVLQNSDPPIVKLLKTIAHAKQGFANAPGPYFGGVMTSAASIRMAQLKADLDNMYAYDAGKWKPGISKVSDRMAKYQSAGLDQRPALKEEVRAELETGIKENETYKFGRKLASPSGFMPMPGYKGVYQFSQEVSKSILDLGFSSTILGIPIAIMANAGEQTQEAIDTGATQEKYSEVHDRNTLLGILMVLPGGRIVTSVPGVKQVVARVESFVGPNGVRVLRVGGEGIEGGATGGIETYFQNVIAKDVYNPDRDTSDGVVQSVVIGTLISSGKTGIGEAAKVWREGRQVLRPVEVDTLRARSAAKLASDLEATMHKIQYGLRISKDPATLEKYIHLVAADRTLQMSVRDFRRLVSDGRLTEDNLRQLGIGSQLTQIESLDGVLTIPLRKLLGTKIAPDNIGDVARSVRLHNKAETGHEADAFLRQRDRRLDELAAQMRAANPETDEGAFAFAHASRVLRRDPALSEEEVRRRAALLTEALLEEAREGVSKAAKYGADFLFFRQISRTKLVRSDLSENARLEQEFKLFRVVRQGTGWPDALVGPADKSGIGGSNTDRADANKPNTGQPTPPPASNTTRRPASPSWSDYPTTTPGLSAVE
ncbi:MAG: hypothetical protein AB7R90_04150 [Reyranellaceae bacterium]